MAKKESHKPKVGVLLNAWVQSRSGGCDADNFTEIAEDVGDGIVIHRDADGHMRVIQREPSRYLGTQLLQSVAEVQINNGDAKSMQLLNARLNNLTSDKWSQGVVLSYALQANNETDEQRDMWDGAMVMGFAEMGGKMSGAPIGRTPTPEQVGEINSQNKPVTEPTSSASTVVGNNTSATIRIQLGLDSSLVLGKGKGEPYYNWAQAGITQPFDAGSSRDFSRAFSAATNKAHQINFNLTCMSDVGDAYLQGQKNGFSKNNFTNAELYNIISNPDLLKKTTFHDANGVVPKEKVMDSINKATTQQSGG